MAVVEMEGVKREAVSASRGSWVQTAVSANKGQIVIQVSRNFLCCFNKWYRFDLYSVSYDSMCCYCFFIERK